MEAATVQLGPLGYMHTDTHVSEILQLEFAHMFETDKSQSNVWANSVTSIQHVISENSDDRAKLEYELRKTLVNTYSKYFSDLDVQCTTSNLTGATFDINITVNVTKDGSNYSLGRELLVNPDDSSVSLMNSINT